MLSFIARTPAIKAVHPSPIASKQFDFGTFQKTGAFSETYHQFLTFQTRWGVCECDDGHKKEQGICKEDESGHICSNPHPPRGIDETHVSQCGPNQERIDMTQKKNMLEGMYPSEI